MLCANNSSLLSETKACRQIGHIDDMQAVLILGEAALTSLKDDANLETLIAGMHDFCNFDATSACLPWFLPLAFQAVGRKFHCLEAGSRIAAPALPNFFYLDLR